MNFLALQFLLYILCLSPRPVEAAESKLESASIAGKINEQWLITAPVTCDGGLGGTEKLHFFPLVSVLSPQSCRKKQKPFMYLVCVQKQEPVNRCWRKNVGSKRRERRGCAPAGNQVLVLQSCVWGWGRRGSQSVPWSVWGHSGDTSEGKQTVWGRCFLLSFPGCAGQGAWGQLCPGPQLCSLPSGQSTAHLGLFLGLGGAHLICVSALFTPFRLC